MNRIISYGALVFLYAPIVILTAFSFNTGRLITVWESFGVHWYAIALVNEDLQRAALNSFIVGVSASVISVLIAVPLALGLKGRRLPVPARHTAQALIILPLLVPEIVIAVATLVFFAAAGLDLGLINVLLAHVAFCIPFAYAPIHARLATIPPALYAAAADLYAAPAQVFRHVTLPLLMPGIVAGALLAFITSLDDFLISQMVAPAGAQTLPVYIYGMVRRGVTPEINAASVILLAVSLAVVTFALMLQQRKKT